MTSLNISDARKDLRSLADKVRFMGERICVERNGEPAFAMVSFEDLLILEALEDKVDLGDAKKAMKERGSVSLDEAKKMLGL
ncbi:type II toxin-antitoxin system Phd/YefM family antitoxin [Planctomycetota bacterium]